MLPLQGKTEYISAALVTKLGKFTNLDKPVSFENISLQKLIKILIANVYLFSIKPLNNVSCTFLNYFLKNDLVQRFRLKNEI